MRFFWPLALASGTLAAVLDLPIWVRNTYSLVEVQVGTPPQPYFLLFDAGSSTTWIDDAACLGTDACPNVSGYARNGYNASASSTSQPMNTWASIDFLGGVTAGSGLRDVFSLPAPSSSSGDNTSSSSVSWTQTFLSANESTWSAMPSDGFLGLAFTTIADANTTTLVETLLQAGQLDRPRMGLYLGTEANDTGAAPGDGVLTLGGSHEDVYVAGTGGGSSSSTPSSAGLNWTTLQTPGENAQLWRTDVQYAVGTQANGTTRTVTASGDWAVFDTGAGRIAVPDPLVEELYASIGMNWTAILAGDAIPLCADFTDDWGLDLYIGDVSAPTQVRITGTMLRLPGFATGEAKYCWPPFDTSGSDGLFLMGMQFLQNFYTVFDFGGMTPDTYNARIGFGHLKDEYKMVV